MLLYFLLFLAFYVITNTFLHKIRNLPPSPFPTLPVIGHLHLFKKPLHRALSKISDRYGPILLLQFGSRRVLLVTSASAAEECLTKNDIAFANRPPLLAGKHLGYNYTSLAWAPYGDNWRNLRRISSLELLSTNRLQMLSSVRADEVKLTVLKLYGNRHRNQAVEMKALFFELTLNVMMRTIAGKRYYGESVEEVEEAKEFRYLVEETFRLSGASNIGDFLPLLNWVGGSEKKLISLQRRREKFLQGLVDEKRRTGSHVSDIGERKKTMIEVLLSLQESEPESYTDPTIRSIMMVLLIAGTDTSAVTMEWAMSLLLNHPEVLNKAQREIDSCVGHDRLIEESDLQKLPYLNCIINETMRMCPAGPLLVPHHSSEECTVGGYGVPSNTMLLINLWAIQNDPKTWEEPGEFKPERFQRVQGGFKFMPFGSGRRRCPGEGLAVRVVGLALGSLLHCFDWERVGKEMVDMTEGTGLTLPKARPLEALCRPRPHMENLLSQI